MTQEIILPPDADEAAIRTIINIHKMAQKRHEQQ